MAQIERKVIAGSRRAKVRERGADVHRFNSAVTCLEAPAFAFADPAHRQPDAGPAKARGNGACVNTEPGCFEMYPDFIGDEPGGDMTVAPHTDAQRSTSCRRQCETTNQIRR